MWDHKVAGVTAYTIWNYFFIFSFLGWVWESCFVSIKNKRPVNRGFVTGPVCTIYGVGAVAVYLLLRPVSGNYALLFFGGIFVATLLEYVTAVVMESIFHMKWWDYSKQRFNFQGRICLGSSIGWGFCSVFLYMFLEPFAAWIVGLYPVFVGKIMLIVFSVIYLADFVSSAVVAYNLKDKLAGLEEVAGEIFEYLQNTRLYSTAGEIRSRVDSLKSNYRNMNFRRKMSRRWDVYVAVWEDEMRQRGMTEESREFATRMAEFKKRVAADSRRRNFLHNRFLSAYPNLRSLSGIRKNAAEQKENQRDIQNH